MENGVRLSGVLLVLAGATGCIGWGGSSSSPAPGEGPGSGPGGGPVHDTEEPREPGSSEPFEPDWTCAGDCGIEELSAGGYVVNYGHSCARLAGGELVCWGGLGVRTLSMSTPVSAIGIDDATSVAAGGLHICAARQSGGVACWGFAGGLGLGGDRAERSEPTDVPGVGDVVELAAGAVHTCARHSDGGVSCWGSSILGRPLWQPSASATRMSGLTNARRITAGTGHTCAIVDEGVVCWGANGAGQLGDGTLVDRVDPVAVEGLSDVQSIQAGGSATCAISGGGAVSCWGIVAPLGQEPADECGGESFLWHCSSRPVEVEGLPPVQALALGKEHACALGEDGSLWCWGSNRGGQIGDGTFDDRHEPVLVESLTEVTHVTAGRLHTCASRGDGSVWCWGDDEHRQVGIGNAAPWWCLDINGNQYPCANVPTPVLGFPPEDL